MIIHTEKSWIAAVNIRDQLRALHRASVPIDATKANAMYAAMTELSAACVMIEHAAALLDALKPEKGENDRLDDLEETFHKWNMEQSPSFVLMLNANGGWWVDNMRDPGESHFLGNTPEMAICWLKEHTDD